MKKFVNFHLFASKANKFLTDWIDNMQESFIVQEFHLNMES
jgi:hypothetical protein